MILKSNSPNLMEFMTDKFGFSIKCNAIDNTQNSCSTDGQNTKYKIQNTKYKIENTKYNWCMNSKCLLNWWTNTLQSDQQLDLTGYLGWQIIWWPCVRWTLPSQMMYRQAGSPSLKLQVPYNLVTTCVMMSSCVDMSRYVEEGPPRWRQ